MYKIEQVDLCYKLTFGDFISESEMAAWVQDSQKILKKAPSTFRVLVDMRALKPLGTAVQEVMKQGQQLFKSSGMERSAVILASTILTIQFKKIAKETGIHPQERYIDASTHPDWETKAMAWLTNGMEPDAGGIRKGQG